MYGCYLRVVVDNGVRIQNLVILLDAVLKSFFVVFISLTECENSGRLIRSLEWWVVV